MFVFKMYHFTERIMAGRLEAIGKDLKGAWNTMKEINDETDNILTKINKRERLVTQTEVAYTKAKEELQAVGKFTINIHLALFYSYAIHCISFVLSLLQISLYLVIGHLGLANS